MNVADLADLLDVLSKQNFLIDANRCISVRNRNVSCGKCIEACVSGCIRIDGRRLLVDTARCIQCGTCATACPTGAIQTINPTDAELFETARQAMSHNDNMLVIACAPQIKRAEALVNPETMVRVPCLGRIDESLILAAAALGAQRIALVASDCEHCSYGKGAQTIAAVHQSARVLLAAWESPCKLKLTQKFPKACAKQTDLGYDFQRRDFLLSIKSTAKTSGRETAVFAMRRAMGAPEEKPPEYEHVQADGTLPHYRPRRRALLSSALQHLGTPADTVVSCRLWRRVRIDETHCSGCQMCAVFCPSAALAKRVEIDEDANRKPLKLYRAPGNPRAARKDAPTGEPSPQLACAASGETKRTLPSGTGASGKVTLVHTPSLCVNCGCCAQLCPHQAISLEASVRARELSGNCTETIPLKNALREKSGPDSIRNSMSKLIDSAYLWG